MAQHWKENVRGVFLLKPEDLELPHRGRIIRN
jgi:hypothetical protein